MLTRLLEALEIKGFMQRGGKKKIAEMTRYSQGSVSDFLSGKEPLADKFLKIICDELSISEQWLKTGEGDMFQAPDIESLKMGNPTEFSRPEHRLLWEECKKLSDDEALEALLDLRRKRAARDKGLPE